MDYFQHTRIPFNFILGAKKKGLSLPRFGRLPDRLMAGQRFLVPSVKVRVLVGQQSRMNETSQFWEVFSFGPFRQACLSKKGQRKTAEADSFILLWVQCHFDIKDGACAVLILLHPRMNSWAWFPSITHHFNGGTSSIFSLLNEIFMAFYTHE